MTSKGAARSSCCTRKQSYACSQPARQSDSQTGNPAIQVESKRRKLRYGHASSLWHFLNYFARYELLQQVSIILELPSWVMKEKQPVFRILPGCPEAVETEAEAKVVDHPMVVCIRSVTLH